MAIITRRVPQCDVCGAQWIPKRTHLNPESDPRKVKRCAACKSARWNESEKQAIAPVNVAPAEPVAPPSTQQGLCRHRLIFTTCPICGGK